MLTYIEPIGHFVLSLVSGALMGCYIAAFILIVGKLHTYITLCLILSTVLCSLFLAVLQSIFTIIRLFSYSFIGSYICIFGFGLIFGNFPNPFKFLEYTEEEKEYPLAWWIYLITIIIIWVVGSIIQFFFRPRPEEKPENIPLIDKKPDKEMEKIKKQVKAEREKKDKLAPKSQLEQRYTPSLREQREIDKRKDILYTKEDLKALHKI